MVTAPGAHIDADGVGDGVCVGVDDAVADGEVDAVAELDGVGDGISDGEREFVGDTAGDAEPHWSSIHSYAARSCSAGDAVLNP